MRLPRPLVRPDGPPIVPSSGWSASLVTLAAAAMAFLAVLTLSGAVAAHGLAAAWASDLAGLATVQVDAPPDRLEARVSAALEVLRTTPGIASARPLTEAEHAALLEPWFGPGADVEALPAPRLIAVTLEDAGPEAARLNARLQESVPGVVYDDHGAWRGPLVSAAARLEQLAWAATALVALAASAMVALTAQATLSANLEVVRVVRLIGAEDRTVARAFEGRLALRGLSGGMIGTGLGVVALSALPRVPPSAAFDLDLAPDRAGWAVILVGVPLASSLIAWATARAAVRLALARLP